MCNFVDKRGPGSRSERGRNLWEGWRVVFYFYVFSLVLKNNVFFFPIFILFINEWLIHFFYQLFRSMNRQVLSQSHKVKKFISNLYRFVLLIRWSRTFWLVHLFFLIPLIYRLLQEKAYPEILRWAENGDSFEILDNELFVQRILPLVSKHQNYASFVRQLNKYSFNKIRCAPSLHKSIVRTKTQSFNHIYT